MPRRSEIKEYRIVARRVEPRHRNLLLRWYGNSSIQKAMEDEPRTAVYLRRKIAQLISSDPFRDGQCAIILEMNSRPVALAHFMWINWVSRTAEIDFTLLSEKPHGLLLGVMAIDKVAQIAFEEFNLHKFYAFIYGDNHRALRFMKRYMRVEAVLKAYLKRGRRYEDAYLMGQTYDEYYVVAGKHYK
ncbi:MAG: GNAT family N-acetyltransferase [Sedimentisphaerales bacterium]